MADATREQAIAWAREHAADGFWSEDLMKFPPPEGWAWCGDQPPYRLTFIAFCNPADHADIHESDVSGSAAQEGGGE